MGTEPILPAEQPPPALAKTPERPPSSPADAKNRLHWVDCAKGIGIVLVVVGHVWYGLFKANIAPEQGVDKFQVDLIYAFHMPLFFLLSGLFIERSAQKSTRKFLWDKVATIAWPYALWTFIHWLSKKVLQKETTFQAPPFTEILLGLIYDPYDHYWFLYVLFLYSLLFLLLYRLRLGLWGIFVVSLVMYVSEPFVEPWWLQQFQPWLATNVHLDLGLTGLGVVHRILRFFVYLAGGALGSRLLIERLTDVPVWVLGLVFLATGLLLVGGVYVEGRYVDGVYQKLQLGLGTELLFACLGIAATLAVAVPMGRAAWLGWLRQVGEMSLPIYLAHILGTAGARIVLVKFLDIRNVGIHVIIGTVVGVLLPIVLVLVARRTRMNWLFSLR